MVKSFNLPPFIKDHSGWVYRIVTLFLAAGALIWTGWDLTNILDSTSQKIKLPSPSRASLSVSTLQGSASSPALSDYSSIVKKNPFGLVPTVKVTPKVEPPPPPPPPPPPELIGTISFGNLQGFAILKETGQNKARVYKIGDSVSGGRTLVQVTRSTVVFNKGDVMETLYARNRPLQSMALQRGGENTQKQLVERNEFMKGISKMVDSSQIRPHFTSGKMDGFTLGRIAPDNPLKAKGFESGDILQGVNDQIIKEPNDIFLLKSLNAESSSTKTTFQIKRRGQPVVLTVP